MDVLSNYNQTHIHTLEYCTGALFSTRFRTGTFFSYPSPNRPDNFVPRPGQHHPVPTRLPFRNVRHPASIFTYYRFQAWFHTKTHTIYNSFIDNNNKEAHLKLCETASELNDSGFHSCLFATKILLVSLHMRSLVADIDLEHVLKIPYSFFWYFLFLSSKCLY